MLAAFDRYMATITVMRTTKPDTAAKVLAEVLRERLSKSPELAAKQRRLLEKLNPPPDKLEMDHQRRMADAVAVKLWPKQGEA